MGDDLILGTAGHIDHGKTALVKALTGTDCDRLPEEKSRGITIDIGFANLQLGKLRLGIIDVPGHERFIKNMLAGATGIGIALLVVAADDSVMPQTREHLEILKLLGISRGVIALTKCDLADETTRAVAALEVRELVKGSFLEAAPLVFTSAHTGEGIPELKAAIEGEALAFLHSADHAPDLPFRLAIDRAFIIQGHGTVVTGSIRSGAVKTGDELDWHRGNGAVDRVRVRGLSTHGQAAETLRRGQRAAINLASIPLEEVHRGQELCATGLLEPSRVLTVGVQTPAESRRSIKHRLPLRLHIGTAEVMATIALLDCDRVEPGEKGLAQLFLQAPVVCAWGQPFVLRDSSAEQTLGGGRVLQPVARKIRRRQAESLAYLEKLGSLDADERILAAGWFEAFHGVREGKLLQSTAASEAELMPRLAKLQAAGKLIRLDPARPHGRLLHAERLVELEGRILAALAAMHTENPLATTLDRQKVEARFAYVNDEAVLRETIDRMIERKALVGDARRVARGDFKPRLSVNQRKLKDQIVAAHAAAGCQPPEPKSFANQAGGNAASLREIYEVAIAEGLLVRVNSDIVLHAEVEAEMRGKVAGLLESGRGATVAEIRDLLGTTRKFAVPLCEYLDRIGLTRRDGDLRFLSQ